MKRSKTTRAPFRYSSFLFIFNIFIVSSAFAMNVEVADAPESNLDLTTAAILSAQKNLLINIYELTSPQVADAIISQVKAGVRVQILEEGSPVGGLSAAAVGVQSQIVQAMRGRPGDLLFQMSSNGGKRRFRFDHAKYVVVDGASLLIGSENYSPTGNPVPGAKGNRGWEVLIHDPAISSQFMNMFASDTNKSSGDITELTSNSGKVFLVEDAQENFAVQAMSPPILSASSVEKITSPDDSVTKIVAAIQNAKKSIDLEQMTFDSTWKGSSSSPLFDAIVAAAKRGVIIRALLNDDRVFDHPGKTNVHKNQITADALNSLAKNSRLKITAAIANLTAMGVDYIHNKGMLIDGNQTLISSINWDENSFQNNRETAVLISSQPVNQFYGTLFAKDWLATTGRSQLEEFIQIDFSFQCPKEVHLLINNIQLQIKDSEDQDFKSLRDLQVDSEFVVQDSSSCIYSASGDADKSKISEKSFFQIRKNSQGGISLIYEGYTPKTGKLFSMRSKLSSDQILGAHTAGVFDGSGPSRESIGQAVFNLK